MKRKLICNKKGSAIVESAIMLALLAGLVIFSGRALGTKISLTFDSLFEEALSPTSLRVASKDQFDALSSESGGGTESTRNNSSANGPEDLNSTRP